MSAAPVYISRSTKSPRRTKADMDAIRSAIYDVLEAEHPMTDRGVFYQLTTPGVIAKTEAESESYDSRPINE